MRSTLIVALSVAFAWSAHAQTGTFAGTVARDTLGAVVPRAEVQLPQLNRSIVANALGVFEFTSVPAGRLAVVVRAVGFQLFVDSVDIARGERLEADIVLTPVPVSLAPARTTATAERHLSAGIQEMEERRQRFLGGHFVTDSALRAHEERKLTYFIARIPGVYEVYAAMGGAVYLANGRIKSGPPCYVDVFVDGVPYYVGAKKAPGELPPDFSAMTAVEYSGIEYYPGGASLPAQYSGTGSGCGVMLLWTRRTP